ncbi:hypothetical protein MP228_012896 [Amoeboaphelidium protococcarum]|nr:hypothetical protein MP228_012896 [Amoeboaphelidium protococcarum]
MLAMESELSREYLQTLDRNKLKKYCQKFNVKIVGSNASLVDKILIAQNQQESFDKIQELENSSYLQLENTENQETEWHDAVSDHENENSVISTINVNETVVENYQDAQEHVDQAHPTRETVSFNAAFKMRSSGSQTETREFRDAACQTDQDYYQQLNGDVDDLRGQLSSEVDVYKHETGGNHWICGHCAKPYQAVDLPYGFVIDVTTGTEFVKIKLQHQVLQVVTKRQLQNDDWLCSLCVSMLVQRPQNNDDRQSQMENRSVVSANSSSSFCTVTSMKTDVQNQRTQSPSRYHSPAKRRHSSNWQPTSASKRRSLAPSQKLKPRETLINTPQKPSFWFNS